MMRNFCLALVAIIFAHAVPAYAQSAGEGSVICIRNETGHLALAMVDRVSGSSYALVTGFQIGDGNQYCNPFPNQGGEGYMATVYWGTAPGEQEDLGRFIRSRGSCAVVPYGTTGHFVYRITDGRYECVAIDPSEWQN